MKKVYEASSPGCSRLSKVVIDLFSSRTNSAFSRLLILVCFAVFGVSSVSAQGGGCPGGACTITCPPDVSLCLAPDNFGSSEITTAWVANHASSPNPQCTLFRVWKDAMGMEELTQSIWVNCDDVGEHVDLWVSVEKPLWVECRSSLVKVRVHIKDCEPPAVVCPPMGMYVCNDDIPRQGEPSQDHPGFYRLPLADFLQMGGTATDACGLYPWVFYRDILISQDPICKTNRTYEREFWVYDVNGNHKGCTQMLVVSDNVPPVFTSDPADLTINCSASNTFKNNEITEWLGKNTNPGNQPGQDAVVIDYCDENMVMIQATPGNAGAILAQMPEACDPNPREVIVVFTANDGCGNESTRSAKVRFVDSTPPTIGSLPTIYKLCMDDVPAADPDGVPASDNCTPSGKIVKEHVGDYIQGTPDCPNRKTIHRVYRATDCSGNSTTKIQQINVYDYLPPYWDPIPTSLNLMNVCNEADLLSQVATWLNDNGGGIGKDNCGVANVWASKTAQEIVDELLGFCGHPPGNTNISYVTFFIKDDCDIPGLPITTWVTLMDNEAPTGTPPPSAMYNCKENVPPMSTSQVTNVSDNCDPNSVLVEIEDNPAAQDGCVSNPFQIIRKWKLTDCAGNVRFLTQVIQVKDQEMPNWDNAPQDISISCDNPIKGSLIEAWLTLHGGGSASDNCTGGVTYTHSPASVSGILAQLGPCAPINGEKVVTFTAKDACGNTRTATAKVVIYDNDAPTATSVDSEYSCFEDIPAVDPAVITDEDDNCTPASDVKVTFHSQSNNGGAGCMDSPYVLTRWYQLQDCAGNTRTVSHRIRVRDMIAPQAYCQALIRNLGANGIVTVTAAEVNNGSFDNCMIDKIQIRRGASGPWYDALDFNCDDIENIPNCAALPQIEGIVEIQMRVTDKCGNEDFCTTTVTVRDVTPPAVECPDDLTIYTDNNGGYDCKANATWTHPIPTDNCTVMCMEMEVQKEINGVFTTVNPANGFPSPGFVTDVIAQAGQAAGPYLFGKGPYCDDDQYRIIYRVRDEHGNNKPGVMCMFTITVRDNEAPRWNDCPEDPIVAQVVTGDCYQMKCYTRPTAYDNCEYPGGPCPAPTVVVTVSDPTIMINQVGDEDCALFPVGVTYVYYTATDAMGNVSTCTVEVRISDQEAPTAMCVGNFTVNLEPDGDIQLQFDDIDAQSFDNCGICIKQISRDNEIYGPTVELDCDDLGNWVTVWLRVGDCSTPANMATCSTQVYVEDMQSPGIAVCPADITVGTDNGVCNAVATYDAPLFNDGCGSPVQGTLTEGLASGSTFPIGVTHVQYCYTSASGYTVCCDFNVTVEDDEAPVITCPADITTLTCLEALPAPMTLANFAGTLTDNCGVSALDFSDYDNDLTHCPYDGIRTIVRTYTAWDAAGNSATCQQTFKYLEDTEPPVLNVKPINLQVDCADEVPPVPTQTATDNCGTVNIDFSEEIQPGGCENQFVVVRLWIATDLCGNSSWWEQTITVHDDEAPVLEVTPLNTQYDCAEDVHEAPKQIFSDNCGIAYENFYETVNPGECPNQYIIYRRWVVADLCGNTAERWQSITVNDNIPPVLLTTPLDLTLECSDEVPDAPVGNATDNCGVVFVDFSEDIQPGGCENQYVIVRRWKATDLCGNTDEHWQFITVYDDEDPVLLTTPLDLHVECAEDVPPAPVGNATDNCDIVFVDFSESEIPGTCHNQYVIVRRWLATDLCGNTDEHWQHITVYDGKAPVFDQPLPDAIVNVDCAQDVPAAAVLTATDNCDDQVNVYYSEELVPGDCDDQFSIIRTWSAEDLCANIVRYTQTINVYDDEAPVWDQAAPDNPTVECSEDVPAVPVQTATDNCGNPVTMDFSEVTVPGTCPNQYQVVRTWVAMDACGNATTRVQTVTVSDTEAPVLAGLPPATVNVECSENVPAVAVVTATDNCDEPIDLDFNEVEVPGTCPNQYVILRTWSAADDCGNATSFVQTITISDTEAPVWDQAAPDSPVDVECSEDVPAVPVQTATDNCDVPVDINFNEVINWGTCSNQFQVVRTWTAADDCGNITTRIQVINVSDTEAPVLAGLPDAVVDVECSEDVPAVANVTATDNCDVPIYFDFSEVEIPGTCPNQYSITRTWTAQDDCGNSTFFVQTINISDTEAPVLVGLPDVVVNVECSEDVPALAVVTATDNCDVPIDVDIVEIEIPGTCPNQYSITRTWTAQDDCGNSTFFVQTINVFDDEAPVFGPLPDAVVNVECSEDVPALAVVTATDNCNVPIDVDIVEIEIPGTCPNQYSITRTWTAQDDCGNSTFFVQTINVSDTEAPVWNTTTQVVWINEIHYDNDGGDVDEFIEVAGTTGTDLSNYSIVLYNGANGLVYGTMNLFGTLGNQSGTGFGTASFGYSPNGIQNGAPDGIALVLNGSMVLQFLSYEGAFPAVDGVATGMMSTDILVSESGSDPLGYSLSLSGTGNVYGDFTWNAPAPNTAGAINTGQTFTPVGGLTLPSDLDLQCGEDVPMPVVLTASDNCDVPVDVEYNETFLPGSGPNDGVTIIRTWTAEDDCGNAIAHTQTITVNDAEPPVLVGTPDITVAVTCSEDVPAVALVTVTDNCQGTVDLDFNEVEVPGTCPNQYSIIRTWSATDFAGNTAVFTQTITINDTEAPVFSSTPTTPLNVKCAAEVPAAPAITATDNCNAPVFVDFSETVTPGSCLNKFTLVRTWVAQDDCGNETSIQQVINVNDDEAPVLACPLPLTAQCSPAEQPPYANLTEFETAGGTASDNCGLNVNSFGLLSEVANGNVYTRTYRVVDQCGNAGTCTQTVTVMDTEPPVFLNCPVGPLVFGNDPDMCWAKVNWPQPVAVDNCSIPTVVQTSGPTSGTIVNVGTYTVSFTATDAMGNTAVCSFQLMVMDTQNPELDADIVMPGDVTVECDNVPAPFVLTNNDVHDNCTAPEDLVITFTEVRTDGNCKFNYILTRTWKVTDEAGKMFVHTQIVTVRDTKAPTAICKAATVTLDKAGNGTLTADQVNNGSFDNCSAQADLTLSVSPNTFTCANLGDNVVTLTVTDECGNSATCTAIVTVVEGIAPCTPQYSVVTSCMGMGSMGNATTLENGQFMDLITVKSLAMQTWTLTANTGLYSTSSPAPPGAPVALTVGTTFTAGTDDGIDNDNDGQTDEADEMIYYTLKGVHVECVGYSISVGNNVGQTGTISNKACYPTPYFTNLNDPFCLNTPPFTIEVGEINGAQGTVIDVMVNGVPTTIFDAGALGLGFHTVMATFDAGAATTNLVINGVQVGGTMAEALADPGCKQKITKIVQVVATPTTIACNDLVNISLHNDGGDCVFVIAPDDVLEGTYLCDDDYSVVLTYPFGTHTFNPPNRIDYTHIGKTLNFSLVHAISGNVCWGQVKVEDKEPPALVCPSDITIKCSDPTSTSFTGSPIVSDCDTWTSVDTDDYTDFGSCSDPRAEIIRTWLVTDKSGNQSSCTQRITIAPFDLADVQFPADVTLNCENVNSTDPSSTGVPTINGSPIGTGGLCMASISKTDEIYDICPGSYEIIRTWKVRNMCLAVAPGNPIEHTQVIKVIDTKGPTFTCPDNVTVSTDPFACCATANLPDVIIREACSNITALTYKVVGQDITTGNLIIIEGTGSLSDFAGNNHWDPDTMAVFGYTQCLPLGDYTVTYTAVDGCGNVSNCTFTMTVEDQIPPVAACDQFTQVALGGDGMAFVNAYTFDDGSYDICYDVHFKARRMNSNDCQTSTQFHDQVKFCCDDINDTILVVFRVYDVPVPNGSIGIDAFEGHYNDCMVNVFVEDKIKPLCNAPANVTVSCENFDPSLWAYGFATAADNCCIDTITATSNYTFFDTLCSKGTITRTFRAFDCGGLSSQCTQRVFVNYEQDYWVKFPNDVIVTVCNGSGNYGEPEFNGEDCELLGVSHEDEIFTVVPDACFKIERTWTIINWCTYNPNAGCVDIPNPNPNATSNNPANLVGPTIAPLGTPQPWTPTNVRVNPTDPQTTNYSVFYHGGTYTDFATGQQITVPGIANNNCFRYKQIIKVIDTQKPIVSDCPSSPVEVCDITPNNAQLWNESYWYDNTTMSHDLCEAPTDLTITATDLCSGAAVNVKYLLFLDLDGDGNMETVISSTNLPGFNNVNFGNASNPNFSGGTPRQFDERPVLPNQKYGFTLQTTVSGTDKVASVRWNTQQQPTNYVVPELPYGTHKIKWIVEDGCGNETVCEYTFVVKDCKKPTVVCLNGLSVNIMPTQMITLWANDFLQYTEDNCTPSSKLVIGIRKSGTGTGFPYNPDGTPQTSVTFDCNELGTQFVELWSIDLAGNADYCETYVIVQDNSGFCSNSAGTVAGSLKTEVGNGLEDANVELEGSHPALPPTSMFNLSNQTGDYLFAGVPYAGDYTVTPTKDNDPLNGVSTFDLVLINKHILGLEPLNSPYKMIAADANNSRSITTFDIVELRKLILGLYTELPNNTSWRFVDKDFTFPDQQNPFSTIFPETKQIANMLASLDAEDFVSVKVGDVNMNAVTSSLMSTEDRTDGTLLFDVQDRTVKAGETFTLNFRAAERATGYQFTLHFPNLEVMEVVPGTEMTMNNFGVFNSEHSLTTSFDNERTVGEFAVTFRAKAAGTLSQMVTVSSQITKAEAYDLDRNRQSVALRFNGANGSTVTGLGFELYQNQPNPWMNKTQIGFYLPEATDATLTIFDESGRTVFTQTGAFGKGYNAFAIERALVNTTGVLYYKLETTTDSAVKKMIQTK
ncbi:MAG: HYR domain-containing protein [Saprospiraceae bacterium]|nr:HYR domain-containing protein [Saprospiraceae bacterium]